MTRSKAVKEATKVTVNSLAPAWGGLLFGVMMGVVGAVPTWKTWLFWGLCFVGMPGIIFTVSYIAYRRQD
jgi:hypothetical protein